MADYAAPSYTENRLQAAQLASLLNSQNLNNQLTPLALQEYGLKPVYATLTPEDSARHAELTKLIQNQYAVPGQWDKATLAQQEQYHDELAALNAKYANPTYVKMTEEEKIAEMTPLEKLMYDNSLLQAERTQKALKGELELDPTVAEEFDKMKETQDEYLAQTLGSGWRGSTVGAQNEANFAKNRALVEGKLAHDEISSGTGLEMMRSNNANATAQSTAGGLSGLGQSGLNYINAYNSVLSPYINERNARNQWELYNSSNKKNGSGLMSSIGSLVGQLGSAGLMAYGMRG